MGCRTLNTEEVVNESEYVGTMLNRHAARFLSQHGPVTETEYSREEAPRRIWDDFTPPDFDYRNRWVGKGGKKAMGYDFYDLTSEDLALENARGYAEFFNDRMGGAFRQELLQRLCGALLDGLCPAWPPVLQRKRPHERPRRSLPDQKAEL